MFSNEVPPNCMYRMYSFCINTNDDERKLYIKDLYDVLALGYNK